MPLLCTYVRWIYIVESRGGVVASDYFGGIVVINLYTLQACAVGVREGGNAVGEGCRTFGIRGYAQLLMACEKPKLVAYQNAHACCTSVKAKGA